MLNFFSHFNPLSTKYDSIDDFKTLNRKQKAVTSIVTGLTTVITLPLLGIGGVGTFRYLTKKFVIQGTAKDRTQDVAIKTLRTAVPSFPETRYPVIEFPNKEGLDLVENDDKPALTNILQSLDAMQKGTFIEADRKAEISQKTDPSELLSGEVFKRNGKTLLGSHELDYACVLRAVQPEKDSKKAIEDQLVYEEQVTRLSRVCTFGK